MRLLCVYVCTSSIYTFTVKRPRTTMAGLPSPKGKAAESSGMLPHVLAKKILYVFVFKLCPIHHMQNFTLW